LNGKVDFSPKVEEACEQCQVWHLVVKRRQGKKVNPTYIRRLAKQAGVENPLSVGLQQACRHYRVADQWYLQLKAKAPEYRIEFLQDRALNKSGMVTLAEQKASKQNLRREWQWQDSRYL